MTEQQKQNVERVLAIAKGYLIRDKKEASIEDAILICDREHQIAEFMQKQGIDYYAIKPKCK